MESLALRKAVSCLLIKESSEFQSGIGVLLLKHVKCKGLWMMPCGKVEENESPKQALVREFKEEINFNLDSDSSVLIMRRPSFYSRIDKDETFDEFVYLAMFDENQEIKNMEPDKAEDLKWVDILTVLTAENNGSFYSENTWFACQYAFNSCYAHITVNKTIEDFNLHNKNFKVKKLTDTARLPERAHSTDSGLDLFSDEVTFTIWPGDRKLTKTGIAIQLPYGFEGQVRPKSGLALKQGITVLNTPGTIDYEYTGEVGVILYNTNKEPVKIERGQKIAQLVITPVSYMGYSVVEELSKTDRGDGGFGSTGLK